MPGGVPARRAEQSSPVPHDPGCPDTYSKRSWRRPEGDLSDAGHGTDGGAHFLGGGLEDRALVGNQHHVITARSRRSQLIMCAEPRGAGQSHARGSRAADSRHPSPVTTWTPRGLALFERRHLDRSVRRSPGEAQRRPSGGGRAPLGRIDELSPATLAWPFGSRHRVPVDGMRAANAPTRAGGSSAARGGVIRCARRERSSKPGRPAVKVRAQGADRLRPRPRVRRCAPKGGNEGAGRKATGAEVRRDGSPREGFAWGARATSSLRQGQI